MTLANVFRNHSGHFRAGWRTLFYVIPVVAFFKVFDFLAESFLLIDGADLSEYPLLFNRFVGKTSQLLATLIPALVLLRWIDKRPTALLGLALYRDTLKELATGILLGLTLGVMTVAILRLTGLATFAWNGLSASLIVYLACVLFVLIISAAYEELLFRGYIFQSLIEGSSFWITLGVYSLLFGVAHIQNKGVTVFYLIFTVAAGVLLGLLYYRSRALWICIGLHFMWNWTLGALFGIGADGHKFLRRTLFEYRPLESVSGVSAETVSVAIQTVMMIGLTILFLSTKWIRPADFNRERWAKYN